MVVKYTCMSPEVIIQMGRKHLNSEGGTWGGGGGDWGHAPPECFGTFM